MGKKKWLKEGFIKPVNYFISEIDESIVHRRVSLLKYSPEIYVKQCLFGFLIPTGSVHFFKSRTEDKQLYSLWPEIQNDLQDM